MLAKLAQDWATALVIVPCWQTQPWFPQSVRLETMDNTAVDTPAHHHQHLLQLATRNKLSTPNLGSAQSGRSKSFWHLPTAGLSPDVTQIIRAS